MRHGTMDRLRTFQMLGSLLLLALADVLRTEPMEAQSMKLQVKPFLIVRSARVSKS